MENRFRWAAISAGILLAVIVGVVSFNAGVSHGIAVAAPALGAAPGTVPPYYWHRPWGFGFGLFPFAFVLFWFLLFRFAFWGRYRRGHWHYRGPYDPPSFDDWHRRAHERMNGAPRAQDQGTV